MRNDIRPFLANIEKPGRYTGDEPGSRCPDREKTRVRVAFCFPDNYEIGMSNLGMRILCKSLNDTEGVACERVYAPWDDMEAEMRSRHIPLFAHESGDGVGEFDLVMFTLQYEMCYPTVLNMLDLAGLPCRSENRSEDMPVIVAGGPCAYNPEPMAAFIDVFSIGEGEEALPELAKLYMDMKADGSYTKTAFLRAVATKLTGFYVPSLYTVDYNEDGTIHAFTPKFEDVPAKIQKRIINDLDKAPAPTCPVMPLIETVQDRVTPEVFRGCIRGCRFCQAGFVTRPVRERSVDRLCEITKETADNTGYDEISLLSLSISDYSHIEELTDRLLEWTDERKINLSYPSLRADSFTKELMDKMASVRTSTVTFAPEAGTQRLRDIINKNVTEEEILRACGIAFAAGKNQIKLYFMDGLPYETDEDLAGIARIADHVLHQFYITEGRNKARPPQVTLSVACFIPKPQTPFQWVGQTMPEELERRQKYVLSEIHDKKIRYNYHDATTSRIEAILARGDRRLSDVLETVVRKGAKFEAWEDHFSYERWMEAMSECGLDPVFYANRTIGEDEILPWDMIDCGVSKEFMLREYHRAAEAATTPSCAEKCSGCGANKLADPAFCTYCPNGIKARQAKETAENPPEPTPAEDKPAEVPQTTEKPKIGYTPSVLVTDNYRLTRLRFAKENGALYIGHLDLARNLTRVMMRSGLPIYYTEGYNPRPKLVFASPLSVGCGGTSEILDIRVHADCTNETVLRKLRAVQMEGLPILEAYTAKKKLTDIRYGRYTMTVHTPNATETAAQEINALFAAPVMMTKKTKSGEKDTDITGYIHKLSARAENGVLLLEAELACDNTNYLNPSYLADAIKKYTAVITPDTWIETVRTAFLREDGGDFR